MDHKRIDAIKPRSHPDPNTSQRFNWVLFGSRLIFCTLLWWILTGGTADSWLVGIPVIVLASALSALLLAPMPFSLVAASKFIGFFVYESVRGGIDVARRALHPRMPLNPGMIEYTLRVRSPPAQVSVSNVMCLLPGTLSADMRGVRLDIHALDVQPHVKDVLEVTEARVAAVFGSEELTDPRPKEQR